MRAASRPHAPAAAALALRFLVAELGALAALAAWGWRAGAGPSRWALALLLPGAVALLWGALIAPRARRRARDPLRLALEILVFAAATWALVDLGARGLAAAYLLVALATALLARRWGEIREPR